MNNVVSHALIVLVLGFGSQAFAQHNSSRGVTTREKDAELQQLGGVSAFLAPQCFTNGSGDGFVQVCITERGNISRFESPQGVVHITGREGYLLTSYVETGDPDHPQRVVHGFDAGTAEAGWTVPIVSQPNGAGTLPLIVNRTSMDGAMQLTQTFTLNVAERGVDITMDVKNLSSVAHVLVTLDRYFDGDMNGSAGGDIYDQSRVAVWGHEKAIPNGASFETLALSGAPSSSVFYFVGVETFADWNPNGSKFQTARGNAGPIQPTPTVAGDLVGRLVIAMTTLAPGQTKSTTVRYRRF